MIGRAAALLADLPADIARGLAADRPRPGVTCAAPATSSTATSMRSRGGRGCAGPSRSRSPGRGRSPPAVELPSGHKVVSDHGATRDLAESLAEGLRRTWPSAPRGARCALLVSARRAVAARCARRPGPDAERVRHVCGRSRRRGRAARWRACSRPSPAGPARSCTAAPPTSPLALLRAAGRRRALARLSLSTARRRRLGETIEEAIDAFLGRRCPVEPHRPPVPRCDRRRDPGALEPASGFGGAGWPEPWWRPRRAAWPAPPAAGPAER